MAKPYLLRNFHTSINKLYFHTPPALTHYHYKLMHSHAQEKTHTQSKKHTMSRNQISQEQNVQESFHSFYERWLLRQQNLIDQLMSVSTMPDSSSPNKLNHQNELIDTVLSHYQEYFEEKTKVANDDVFLLFSPTWLSSYERALLWIGDYKPSLILRLADGAVTDLTGEQMEALEEVRSETRRAERELSGAMAGVQESVAGPRVLGLARKVGRLLNGEISELDDAVEGLRRVMVGVSERGDELRVATVMKVVEVLRPPQTVQFLAAAMRFQLRARRWGFGRDDSPREV